MNSRQFNKEYYERNCQDRDRPALWFYSRLVRRWLAPGPVLDFGCGTGFLLRRLNPHLEVAGLEKSEYCRQQLAAALPGVTIHSEEAKLPRDFFCGVVSLHVFEHIIDSELRTILRQLHASLKTGGRILCVMPDAGGKGVRLKGENWSGYGDPTHVNLKTASDWQEFFSANGFKVLKCGTDGLWDFPYRREGPLWFDYCQHACGTVLQFLFGRLILPLGSGESVILLLQKEI